jgi:calcineurin-like phosphoesterase family protein
MNNVWVTSDTHFGHAKIMEYCKRPFATVAEMDEALITNWNALVHPGDRVYHLGDFSFGDPYPYLKHLNGQKYLILGNHDDFKAHEAAMKWNWMKNLFDLKVDKQTIVLGHYGQRVWNKMHYGSWHLYGHSHGGLPPYGKSFDVGVDCWNYKPVSYDQIKEKMDTLDLITGIAGD